MLGVLQLFKSVHPACRGVATGHGGRPMFRDEISPDRRECSQPEEAQLHHGVKPGVDTPKTRQWKD
ncbi:hypothetical protein FNH09_44855 [Streptomyces adustus]|uniref:Uncharacterized protein n=1 Tax=Streptomyces adustus TaxID=1609272 RepID=A0A5N8VS25_9ACTN|nr:hypothetical protein [Streptomyces adustus]